MDAGILIVAAQRDLRRALFDALDRAGHPPTHTARGLPHAGILLDGGAPLNLVVAVFDRDAAGARDFCERLRRIPACAEAALIAVLAPEATLQPTELPPGVSDWLHAGQVDTDLVPRWRRLQPAVAATPAGSDPYRFAFEEDDSEWLIVDPRTGGLLEASPAVARNSQLDARQLLKLPLHEVVVFEGITAEHVLEHPGRQWHPCQRRTRYGVDTGQASARPVSHGGRDAVALLFRSDRADLRAEAALGLLARMFGTGGGLDMHKLVARLLLDELVLDYLALWSAHPEAQGAPTLLTQLWRGDAAPIPVYAQQSSLRLVLDGRTMLHPLDAQRLAAVDPLLEQLKLVGFAGLPLLDERRTVIGALLVGRRAPLGEMAIIEPVLRCAAARFAHTLELRRTREQGRAEGLIDALTGLPNRLLFNDRLDTILREARRTGESFALLFVDLDRFKQINDSYGHAAGDQVLREVTRRLTGSIRASDTVARYAGDEFIVVLRHVVKSEDVLRVAEKIVQVMEAPLTLDGTPPLQVTTSIGISFYPDDAADADTLLKHADQAMYAAKHHGRNNFQLYEVAPEQVQRQDVAMRTRLRHALHNNELRVVYQPQVDAASEDIVGMEALVRWESPELGPVSPGVFIPLAEETGLIVAIGEWVLRTACQQAQEWERRYGLRLRLGVNLSALQLMEADLLDAVGEALRGTGLDPALLELEVTESISIKAVPNLVDNLHGLHRLGCRIAIDDFGTGAASLDYLRKLPADRIKIDQSFVRNIGIDPDDEAIVRATIEMAHRLNRSVVAEGVEIEQHLQFLRANQCDELQGYLFCRPLPPASFDRLLAERQRLLAETAQPA
ncbi:putative bifunctional diguanylate cyclase/phosphodiesterase [Frateuria defendens]|uniref:putative bifunctional diguanylate cyclase/phosphodiesterase n=1 Tax=Frateuria defendens TaxID=2219559 RepID=UPI00066FC79E|nr:EAL domain-containing protein [Frateuria defendens]